MTNPAFSRAATAYQSTGIETSVNGASPHQLIVLLFDSLQQALNAARLAMQRKDIEAKGKQITRAVRLLEEGLKAGLDMERGGELARNLRNLYDYCSVRLTQANLRNDVAAIDEVQRLIHPVAEAWKQIGTHAQDATAMVQVVQMAASSVSVPPQAAKQRPGGAYAMGLSAYSAMA
jgi:flagellar protein FliS